MMRRRTASGKVPSWRSHPPTPIMISPRMRWILTLLGIIALIFLVRAAPSILAIVLGGFALALVLSFPVRAMSYYLPRAVAILLTFLALFGLIGLAVFALVPTLIDQLSALISATPALADQADRLLRDILTPLQERGLLTGTPDDLIAQAQEELISRAQMLAQQALTLLLSWVAGAINLIFTTFGMIFVSIYLLGDTRKLKAAYLKAAPHHYRPDAAVLWGEFGFSLSRYVAGLFVVIVVQGIVSTVALSLIGIPYPFVLGAWVSATAILPFIGAWLGAIPAVAIAAFISPTKAVLVILAYIGIQQLEGNVLTPRIQGQALRVHPILVFLAVIIGVEVGGIMGAIFAVPALAVLRVLTDFLRRRLRVARAVGPIAPVGVTARGIRATPAAVVVARPPPLDGQAEGPIPRPVEGQLGRGHDRPPPI